MGFLDRMRGRSNVRELVMLDVSGPVRTPVVGESHYQDALARVGGPKRAGGIEVEVQALLVAEPSNPYDANAVAVQIDGCKVGYLGRDDAITYAPLVTGCASRGQVPVCEAIILGGDASRRTQYCVWLHTIDPYDVAG